VQDDAGEVVRRQRLSDPGHLDGAHDPEQRRQPGHVDGDDAVDGLAGGLSVHLGHRPTTPGEVRGGVHGLPQMGGTDEAEHLLGPRGDLGLGRSVQRQVEDGATSLE
jgi:hypothetical protein